MQQNDRQFAQQRVATHTKLFEIEGRQVVAFLNRTEDDALVVILQLWVAASDEQLRVAVRTADEPSTQEMFDLLDGEMVEFMLTELKVNELVEGLSA